MKLDSVVLMHSLISIRIPAPEAPVNIIDIFHRFENRRNIIIFVNRNAPVTEMLIIYMNYFNFNFFFNYFIIVIYI